MPTKDDLRTIGLTVRQQTRALADAILPILDTAQTWVLTGADEALPADTEIAAAVTAYDAVDKPELSLIEPLRRVKEIEDGTTELLPYLSLTARLAVLESRPVVDLTPLETRVAAVEADAVKHYCLQGNGSADGIVTMYYPYSGNVFLDRPDTTILLSIEISRLDQEETLYQVHALTQGGPNYNDESYGPDSNIVRLYKTGDNRLAVQIGKLTVSSLNIIFSAADLHFPLEVGVMLHHPEGAATVTFFARGTSEAAQSMTWDRCPYDGYDQQHIIGKGFTGRVYFFAISQQAMFLPETRHTPPTSLLAIPSAYIVSDCDQCPFPDPGGYPDFPDMLDPWTLVNKVSALNRYQGMEQLSFSVNDLAVWQRIPFSIG